MLADKVSEACEYIKSRITREPAVALVLGSGLGSLADKLTAPEIIPYSDIPYWPRTTAIGHAGRLVAGRFDNSNTDVVIMQGRVHYYEGYTMSEVTFPTRVLAQLGVRSILFTNASGAVNPDIATGTIVAIEDHINYMGTNPLIGINNDEWGPRFPDMTRAYDKKYISLLEKIAADNNITLKKGVYIAFSGPSFETPSEVRMAGMLGADIVGMSTVPEVIVANHMGLRVCGLSCAANLAAGLTDNILTQEEVLDTMSRTVEKLSALIEEFVREMDS